MNPPSRPVAVASTVANKKNKAPRRKPVKTVDFAPSDEYYVTKGADSIMTAEQYKTVAKQIAAKVRMPHDPSPRVMEPGTGTWNTPCQNVARLLEDCAPTGSVLVRGYRMVVISISESASWLGKTGGCMWKAIFHVVVAHPPKDPTVSDKWIYECATAPEDIADRKKSFIFVPSSRAHAELTDEQILSGYWFLGIVLGGNDMFAKVVAASNACRGRESSMIGAVSEQCIAKRCMVYEFFPHFKAWYIQKRRTFTADTMAELMGFPCADAGSREGCGEMIFDDANMATWLDNNQTSLIDGGRRSVLLGHEVLTELYQSTATFEGGQARWYAHYDTMLEEIERITEQHYEAELAKHNLC